MVGSGMVWEVLAWDGLVRQAERTKYNGGRLFQTRIHLQVELNCFDKYYRQLFCLLFLESLMIKGLRRPIIILAVMSVIHSR